MKIMNLEMNEIETRRNTSTSFKTISSFTSKATNDSPLNESNLVGENSPFNYKYSASQLKMNKGSFRSTGPYSNLQGSFTYRC